MDVELVVAEDADDAALRAARELAEAARAGGHVALSGGRTPRAAYSRAAVLASDWGGVQLWFADERCVPPDDERSNHRLVREALLDLLARRPEVHRVLGEQAAEDAADAYETAFAGVRLDFALLGIGPDGHTASLFPNAPTLDVTDRRVTEAQAALEPFVDRVTLTIPPLSAARRVLFLVVGAEKAEAVERAFARDASAATPASLIRGETTIAILDRAAAARVR